jgi:hypothetical protein
LPKKKKKHADFDNVEIEKYPFIGNAYDIWIIKKIK